MCFQLHWIVLLINLMIGLMSPVKKSLHKVSFKWFLFVIPHILLKFVFIFVHRWWTIVTNDCWRSNTFLWYSFQLLPTKWRHKRCFLGRKNGNHGFFLGGSQRICLQQFPFKAGLSIGNSVWKLLAVTFWRESCQVFEMQKTLLWWLIFPFLPSNHFTIAG